MQTSAPRKDGGEAAAARAPAKAVGAQAEAWALRVLDGLHVGAERRLPERCMLLIGSSDDCDLIFSDADVAPHHCFIARADGELSVRAVDADVRIDDRIVHPGEPQRIEPFSRVGVGGAGFAVGPHWSDRWQALPTTKSAAARATQGPRKPGWAMPLAIAALLFVAGTTALVVAQRNRGPEPPPAPLAPRDAELRTLLDKAGYKGLVVDLRKDGLLAVGGYVETKEALRELRERVARGGFNAVVEAKSGPGIASDIAESMRMSNLHATTEWKGDGKVLVTGHFGDNTEIDAFVRSRTMTDFNRNLNLKFEVANLDTPKLDAKPVPEGKRIVKVVKGDDPYLVTADGSKYYVDAKLPSGGTFQGVDNDEILVRDDAGNIQRLPHERVVDVSSP